MPSVSAKDNVTQLDIILEAIRYIDSLQNKLADKIEAGEIELVKVPVQPVKKITENWKLSRTSDDLVLILYLSLSIC